MHIVGIEAGEAQGGEAGVHTIDVWYSARRRAWIVERLDAQGGHLGVSHACASRQAAMDCLAEWLRAHPEAVLAAPVPDAPSAARPARRLVTRRAAFPKTRKMRHEPPSVTARA